MLDNQHEIEKVYCLLQLCLFLDYELLKTKYYELIDGHNILAQKSNCKFAPKLGQEKVLSSLSLALVSGINLQKNVTVMKSCFEL